jgi:hypothetical protein
LKLQYLANRWTLNDLGLNSVLLLNYYKEMEQTVLSD